MKRYLLALLIALMIAAACGGRDDNIETGATGPPVASAVPDDDGGSSDTDTTSTTGDGEAEPPEETPTEVPEVDPCADVAATDTGITADTISVVVMADVGSPLAPGLFQGSIDGVNAWAEHVNGEGGLACRQVEVIEWDSMLNGNETTNGFLKACSDAAALVGTTVLFGLNTEDLNTCPDSNGDAIGVADISYITTEPPHQCSQNSFHLSRPGSSCPFDGGTRDFVSQVGPVQWLLDNVNAELNGIYMVPADLPSTIGTSYPLSLAQEAIGVTWADQVGVSGSQAQAAYGEIVQPVRDDGLNYVYNGSNDQSMLKMMSEAAAQGLDLDSVTWMCSLACYTPDFLEQGGDTVENTYVWMWFLPFTETDANPELGDFISSINNPFPQAWAAGAWGDGVLFEQVISAIVERDGVNGVTRASILDQLRNTTSFDVNGWWGEADLTNTLSIANCWVLMQVQGGEFARVWPETEGELECTEPVATSGDPSDYKPS